MTSSGSRRKTVFRWVRWLIAAVLAVLLLPYLLAPLYRVVDPVSTLMLARWATGKRVVRTVVPLERIAPVLSRSVIASEDGRFCTHRGIDWQEIRERLEDIDDIGAARAVSTITQQTAKNLFLWPGRSFLRKALELPLALWMDLSKLPADPARLQQLYERTPPAVDGITRVLYASALAQAGQKDQARKLLELWPLPGLEGDPLLQSLLFPKFLELKKQLN